jgi:hypothetical protein
MFHTSKLPVVKNQFHLQAQSSIYDRFTQLINKRKFHLEITQGCIVMYYMLPIEKRVGKNPNDIRRNLENPIS